MIKCRQCGACCIALRCNAIPGMPNGKAAGERCRWLSDENRCRLHGTTKPDVCKEYPPTRHQCGRNFEDAMVLLTAIQAMCPPVEQECR